MSEVQENNQASVVSQPQSVRILPVGITGLGAYLPERVLTNADLESIVETNDEWIRSRTGIGERRIAAPDQTTADLAEKASRAAIEDAGIQVSELDLIIVATCTPDYPFPSTASLLQDRLGATCAAFDLGAACSGFTYALVTAQQFVATGAAKTVLVVGAEVMSRVLDWTDRNTCVLFGDGAGAAIVQSVPEGFGVQGFDLGSDGSGGELLKIEKYTAGESAPTALVCGSVGDRRIFQNGREVYRFAVNVMGESAARALDSAGISGDSIDLFVPHQANVRIIDSAAKRLGVGSDRVFVNVEKYGNTSAASIPIALREARDAGRINRGDTVVMVGFGGGLSWGSLVVKWY
ncbi:MAG TPA: beta-ketoacyl-ACP synthase III [Abditibacteriaceae bacterium]